MNPQSYSVTFVIVGASGDLARRKIVPALFALYCDGRLSADFRLFGYSRTKMDDIGFREMLSLHLTCRIAHAENCAKHINDFLEHCFYQAGSYDSQDDYRALSGRMLEKEGKEPANRVFYMAIPPEIFSNVSHTLNDAGLVGLKNKTDLSNGWSRVVVEKPFGYDRTSSDLLAAEMAQIFDEKDIYRIDHYLGKELVQNLMILRFANRVFEPIWSHEHIRAVRIKWCENIGLSGRAGFFDQAGIIRDVIQNHLLQILALVAMEPPSYVESMAVRDAKVALLRKVKPASMKEAVFGQYIESVYNGMTVPSYRNEPGVSVKSRTPTYAALRLTIDTPRWQGVPFEISAGKGLSERISEVRIEFKPVQCEMFFHSGGQCPLPNELVLRIQPDEAIRLHITGKQPGLALLPAPTELNLLYRDRYGDELPEAYERLLLDVLAGERGFFIRNDELEAAWDIVTPLLAEWDASDREPEFYPFGSNGPLARLPRY